MRRKDHLGIYTELINIRVTPQQKKFLVKMAKKYKQSLSAYLRDWMFMDMFDPDDP